MESNIRTLITQYSNNVEHGAFVQPEALTQIKAHVEAYAASSEARPIWVKLFNAALAKFEDQRTQNEVLAELGYGTRPVGFGRMAVVNCRDIVMFTGNSSAVWTWLRTFEELTTYKLTDSAGVAHSAIIWTVVGPLDKPIEKFSVYRNVGPNDSGQVLLGGSLDGEQYSRVQASNHALLKAEEIGLS